jgi:dCMP deaminase
MTRPSWDEVWMHTANAVAKRSLCTRAQVGAVIVTVDNVVVAASYNGPPPKFLHYDRPCTEWCERAQGVKDLSPAYLDCPSTHAEMSAIARADRSECQGATLYVTDAVCYPCAKVIPQTGITRVVHSVRENAIHRQPEKVELFLELMGIQIIRV